MGRAASGGLASPPLEDGNLLLGADCAAVNMRLKAAGPPCFVEDWTDGARTLRVERSAGRLRFDGGRGRTRWSQVSGTLGACLGDALAVPPAGDPGGLRTLEGTTWVLTFSGNNACGIAGELRLDATRDHADWSGVRARGLPWAKGGREAVEASLPPG